jgi:hypothetical protein
MPTIQEFISGWDEVAGARSVRLARMPGEDVRVYVRSEEQQPEEVAGVRGAPVAYCRDEHAARAVRAMLAGGW